jgi:hypothetical protein
VQLFATYALERIDHVECNLRVRLIDSLWPCFVPVDFSGHKPARVKPCGGALLDEFGELFDGCCDLS